MTTASGKYATAFGYSTNAGATYSTAWGFGSSATEIGATAWGGGYYDSVNYAGGTALGRASTAWGVKTIANGSASTAFGEDSKAGGENSLAALGGTTGTWTEAPEYSTTDKKWTKTGTVSSETGKTGANAVAIGQGANAKYDNSVAIGQYAVTTMTPASSVSDGADGFIDTNEFAVGGGTYTDGNSKTHVVYSRITGVADGTGAHDAATVGQIKGALGSLSFANNKLTYTNLGATQATEIDLSSLGGTTYKAGTNIAIADDGTISATDTTYTGDGANISIDTENKITLSKTLTGLTSATFSGAVTAGSFKIDNDNSWDKTNGLKAGKVTVGNVVISNNKITGLADGTVSNTSTDAVNGKQLYNATTLTTAGKNYAKDVNVVTAVGNLDTKIGTYDATNVKGKYTNGGNVATDVKALDTQVKTNTDAIGDASSGLVKDVADNKAAIAERTIKALGTGETNLVLANDGKLTLTKTVNLTEAGSLTIGNSVLNKTGLAITGGPSLTTTNGLVIGDGNSWTSTGITAKAGTFSGAVTAGSLSVGTGNTWTAAGALTATSIATTTGTFGSKVIISADGIAMGSQKITDLADPTAEADATNKKYVDTKVAGAVAGLSDVMSTSGSKLVADGVVAKGDDNDGTKEGHIVTGATVYNAMCSAVGDAFTGATDSKGLTYSSDGDGKLIANVAFEGTSATFSGYVSGASGTIDTAAETNKYFVTGVAVYSAIKNNISYESDPKTSTDAVADEISLRSHTASEKTYGTLIHNVQDGVVANDAVNKGQLDVATTMSEAGNNYAVSTSVTDAVKALDTALGTYNSETMKNNTYAKNGVVAADISALDTQVKKNTDAIGDMSGFASNNYATSTVSVAENLTKLDTAIADINNASTGVLAQAKTYTDNLANGQVKTNKEAIEAINNTETGILKNAKDYTDALKDGQVTTNKNDIAAINTTIGTYSSVKDTQGITYAKTGTITGDVIVFDKTLAEHAGNIADLYSKVGVGTSGESNVYIGKDANATGVSVAIGSGAQATGANTVSIGTGSEVTGDNSIAVGTGSEVIGDNSIAVGNGHKVTGKNSGTFGDPNKVYADNSYAYGNNNTLGVETVPEGETQNTNIVAVGNSNTVTGDNTFVLGSNVTTSATNSVILGNNSSTKDANGNEQNNVVSVGNAEKGGQRKIVYVADGNVAEGSTDAVNGGQLWKVEQKIDENIQNEINTINNHIDRMGTRINKVGAGAAALAAMHPVYDEDSKLTFSAGLGSYRNEQAAAVGMFFRFSPRVMMNAGATVGNDNNMYNVGLNFALDRHVRGGLPSKAVMAKQLNSLTLENSALKEKLATMDAKMVQQGEQIAQLMAMIEELRNK